MIRPIPTHKLPPVLPSFPHAFSGNPVRSHRVASSVSVALCTRGRAGSPTKTFGEDDVWTFGEDDVLTLGEDDVWTFGEDDVWTLGEDDV
jgi:hypothetical protein